MELHGYLYLISISNFKIDTGTYFVQPSAGINTNKLWKNIDVGIYSCVYEYNFEQTSIIEKYDVTLNKTLEISLYESWLWILYVYFTKLYIYTIYNLRVQILI